MKFQRETATHEDDLPHQFDGAPATGCVKCGTGSKDPRHMAWEMQALADRENASEDRVFPRETGS